MQSTHNSLCQLCLSGPGSADAPVLRLDMEQAHAASGGGCCTAVPRVDLRLHCCLVIMQAHIGLIERLHHNWKADPPSGCILNNGCINETVSSQLPLDGPLARRCRWCMQQP